MRAMRGVDGELKRMWKAMTAWCAKKRSPSGRGSTTLGSAKTSFVRSHVEGKLGQGTCWARLK
jgi:hypothetical protein